MSSIKIDEIRNFKFLAFDDYIAARKILLSNKEHRNGIILASTCVEKYFKAFLACFDVKKRGHMGEKLIRTVEGVGDEGKKLIGLMDQTFLKLLTDSYSLRYLDSNKNKVNSFSFCVSQVICELDYVVNIIEHSIMESGKVSSRYEKALSDISHILHVQNYISSKQAKDFWMSQSSPIYAIKIINSSVVQLSGSVVVPGKKYDGNIRVPVEITGEKVPQGKPFKIKFEFDCDMPGKANFHVHQG